MEGLIDLHTHSHHSDGTLPPAEVVARAAARGVTVLALTDHDTTAGLQEAATACAAAGISFVQGVEVTAGWRGQEIHVVGLGIDATAAPLKAHLEHLVRLRRERVVAIGEKLRRHRKFAGIDPVGGLLESGAVPTRTHVARAIAQAGLASSVQDAFDKFLGRGCAGYVGLAHPHRYRLSAGALRSLCAEFRDAGGSALEVRLPALSPTDATRLASLAREHGLAG